MTSRHYPKDARIFQYPQIYQCNTPYSQIEKQKQYDYLNRCRESLWQNSTPIYDQNSPETRHRGNIPQHNKTIYNKPAANIILNVEKINK